MFVRFDPSLLFIIEYKLLELLVLNPIDSTGCDSCTDCALDDAVLPPRLAHLAAKLLQALTNLLVFDVLHVLRFGLWNEAKNLSRQSLVCLRGL